MTEDDDAYNRLLLTDPEAARAQIGQDREWLLAASASEMAQGFAASAPPVDAAVLQGEMTTWLAYAIHDGLAPGSQGWCDDAFAHIRPWGFELAGITVPVLLLHGRQDTEVPFGHGQWLATRISGSKHGCSTTTGTRHSQNAASATCTPGCPNACRTRHQGPTAGRASGRLPGSISVA